MPRKAREKSKTGIYHVMLRGVNGQSIFEDEADCEKFIEVLEIYKREIGCIIYAYCLLNNHVHLLIKEGEEELSNTMKRIGARYVYWYNWQYNRKGHLFQGRYKSEPVEEDAYFLTVLRYIHQNPVKAGLTKDIAAYRWSSYNEYTGKERVVHTDFALNLMDKNREKAMQSFIAFHKASNGDQCLEITPPRKTISDKEIKQLVWDKYNIALAALPNASPTIQKEVLKYVKGLDGSSLRQLSRLTGFTVNKIYRA